MTGSVRASHSSTYAVVCLYLVICLSVSSSLYVPVRLAIPFPCPLLCACWSLRVCILVALYLSTLFGPPPCSYLPACLFLSPCPHIHDGRSSHLDICLNWCITDDRPITSLLIHSIATLTIFQISDQLVLPHSQTKPQSQMR